MARQAAFVCAFVLIAGLNAPVAAEPIEIAASPITAFDRNEPERRRFGSLLFLGGLQLSSSDPRFGGVSGAEISRDGRRILMVTDEGNLLSASVGYHDGRPGSLADADIHPLVDESGAALDEKFDSDAEAVRAADGEGLNGDILVSFEREHRVLRYALSADGAPGPATRLALPDAIDPLPGNQGIEALAVMPTGAPLAGATIAVAESSTEAEPNLIPAWVVGADGDGFRFSLERFNDFNVTDAVALQDGGLLVLERRFALLTGLSMRIRVIEADEFAPDLVVKGNALLTASMSYEVDNMEALAVHRDEDGRQILTIVSDDNFNAFQRTILLQFALE